MNWEAIGAIANVLGTVGVVITLAYVALQIKQNTVTTRLSMSNAIAAAARDWNRPLLLDSTLAWTFQVGTEDPTALDEKERARFIELCFSLFRMFEDAFYQYQNGALDPEVWSGYEKLYIAYARAPGFQMYWNERCDTFRPAFREFIDRHGSPEVATWGRILQRANGHT